MSKNSCPHAYGFNCGHPTSLVFGKAMWLCKTVQELKMGCPAKNPEILQAKVEGE